VIKAYPTKFNFRKFKKYLYCNNLNILNRFIQLASERGHSSVVTLLIQAFAGVNIRDNNGYTALIEGILIKFTINLKNEIKIILIIYIHSK
jgi:hypothetical protein